MKNLIATLTLMVLTVASQTTAHADEPNLNKVKNLAIQLENEAKKMIVELEPFRNEREFQSLRLGAGLTALFAQQINQLSSNPANLPLIEDHVEALGRGEKTMQRNINALRQRLGLSATRDLRDAFDDVQDTIEDLEDELDE